MRYRANWDQTQRANEEEGTVRKPMEILVAVVGSQVEGEKERVSVCMNKREKETDR